MSNNGWQTRLLVISKGNRRGGNKVKKEAGDQLRYEGF